MTKKLSDFTDWCTMWQTPVSKSYCWVYCQEIFPHSPFHRQIFLNSGTIALTLLTFQFRIGYWFGKSIFVASITLFKKCNLKVEIAGMIMGLGRRKRSDFFSDELSKRHSAFLEDTGTTDKIYHRCLFS